MEDRHCKEIVMLDVIKVQEEAEKEIREELTKKAKERIKGKFKQIADAKTIVANLEREYQDLLITIGDGN